MTAQARKKLPEQIVRVPAGAESVYCYRTGDPKRFAIAKGGACACCVLPANTPKTETIWQRALERAPGGLE